MSTKRMLRYLAPNLITTLNVLLGLMSVAATYRGEFELAAWLIVYAAIFDRLDGFTARLLHGASEFGVQMDSFADFLNFGLAPAALVYVSMGESPELPFGGGLQRTLMLVACALWCFAAAFRLARYNITEDVPSPLKMKIFFGVPTTLAGGLLATWFLALYKYSPPGQVFPALPEAFGGPRLVDLETPVWVWQYTPVLMLIGAYLMASSLRMPKIGVMRSKILMILVYVPVFVGLGFGVVRIFPEYMVWPPTLWTIGFLIWGALSQTARNIKPPPIFPVKDPPPGKEPMRPEEHFLPDGVDPELEPEAGKTSPA